MPADPVEPEVAAAGFAESAVPEDFDEPADSEPPDGVEESGFEESRFEESEFEESDFEESDFAESVEEDFDAPALAASRLSLR
jgi:hypothetical protein